MYFVGIDISKYKHDCFITNDNGQTIHEPFSFKNNSEGFNELLSVLESLDSSKEIRIGFESTAHYSYNLKIFLTKNRFTCMELHPLLVKQFVSTLTLRKTKTDSKDCKSIAAYLRTIDYKPILSTFYHKDSLKSLTRLRELLIKNRSNYLVQITNILDKIFPEFKPFINDLKSQTALYILKNYSIPEKISMMTCHDELRCISRGKFTYAKFNQLIDLAKSTVGFSYDSAELELQSYLTLYETLSKQINKIEGEITLIINSLNPKCLQIRGIGPITAAIIVSEYGDFNSFKSADAMVAFAGLDVGIFQSGTESHNGKMVKHGSPHLRYALLNVTAALLKYNYTFAAYYNKKRHEGKSHRVALTHLAKKLIRIIYHLEINQLDYNESKLI